MGSSGASGRQSSRSIQRRNPRSLGTSRFAPSSSIATGLHRSRRTMGRTGAGLVLAVLVVAALGAGYLAVNSGRQASTSASTATTTAGNIATTNSSTSGGAGITISASTIDFIQSPGSMTPDGCSTLINAVSSQGFQVETYVASTSAKVGSVLCIDVVLLDVSGPNLTQQSTGYTVTWNVTDSSGRVVFESACYPSPPPQSPGVASSPSPPVHWVSCSGAWDTSSPFHGVTPQAGTYQVTETAIVPTTAASAANFPTPGASGYQTINSNSTLTLTN